MLQLQLPVSLAWFTRKMKASEISHDNRSLFWLILVCAHELHRQFVSACLWKVASKRAWSAIQDPVPSPTKPNFHYTKWKSGFARLPDNIAVFCNISPSTRVYRSLVTSRRARDYWYGNRVCLITWPMRKGKLGCFISLSRYVSSVLMYFAYVINDQ